MEEDHQAADEDIDIDLDLTSDPLRNINDDEMIEDPEINAGQPVYTNTEVGLDEQMLDDADRADADYLSEHDEYLEDVDFAENTDDLDVPIEDTEHLSQLLEDKPDLLSQQNTYENLHGQNEASQNSYQSQESNVQYSPSGLQATGGQTQIHEQPATPHSSAASVEPVPERSGQPGDAAVLSRDDGGDQKDDIRAPSAEFGSVSQDLQGIVEKRGISTPIEQSQQNRLESSSTEPANPTSKSTHERVIQGTMGSESTSQDGGQDSISRSKAINQLGDTEDAPQSHRQHLAASPLNVQDDDFSSRVIEIQKVQEFPDRVATFGTHDVQEDDASQETLYVHPVVIMYQESEMFLFPPAEEEQDHSQTYFLSEEALATETIGTLLKECRKVLEGSISDQEELEIIIGDLGLSICEVSQSCNLSETLLTEYPVHY